MPRLWILLMLAYGLLLRLDINRQLVRKAFKADNASVYMNCTFDLVRECLRCDNRTSRVFATQPFALGRCQHWVLAPSVGTYQYL